jgi:hypothetical protein
VKLPEQIFRGYTAEQWQQIKSTVDRLGVDADTFMLGKHRLQDELEKTARWFLAFTTWQVVRQTPKQKAATLRARLSEIKTVRRHFARCKFGDGADYVKHGTARALVKALNRATAQLQAALDVEANRGSRSKQNASKGVRRGYLTTLIEIWDRIPGAKDAQRKLLIAFLLACSAPTFRTDQKAITNFLDNLKRATETQLV